MPELGPNDSTFEQELRRTYANPENRTESESLSTSKLLELCKEYDADFVGKGAEVVVIDHADKPDKIIAYSYKGLSPRDAKETFYMHRIFSTMFPHNFPHFYASGNSGNVRDKINRGKLSAIKDAIKFRTNLSLTKYPFKDVRKICNELGMDFIHDSSDPNFIFGSDGGEYYVDQFLYAGAQAWDVQKIIGYMDEKEYSPEQVEIVKNSIQRLRKITRPANVATSDELVAQ